MSSGLGPGAQLSHFRILDELGAGGMGVVFRATDTRLGREVALKVLPEGLLDDPDRLARFEREARVLASLDHPNVAAAYDVGQATPERAEGPSGDDGEAVPRHFIVMQLAPGEDLAERLARGPIPPAEVVAIAAQIASGLEAAHEAGVVHRDLKPANVKVDAEGRVRILDFGLARALSDEDDDGGSPDTSVSPTLTARATQAGVLLGTAAYMAPEQARGQAVDKRADVWAFGVVVWEMLVGRRLFEGATVSDTLAAVLRSEIGTDALPAGTPPWLRRLVGRCLERDPRRRLRDIGEARIVLEDPPDEPAEARVARAPSGARILVASVLSAAVAAGLTWALRPIPERPLRRLVLPVGDLSIRGSDHSISPDGRMLAYVSGDRLLIRHLDELEPREVPQSQGASFPFWAPDSSQVGYVIEHRLWRVASSGVGPVPFAELSDPFRGAGGASWAADGRVVFSTGLSGLLEVPAEGGDPRPLLEVEEGEADFHSPSALPGNRGALFAVHHGLRGLDSLAVFDGRERREVLQLPGQRVMSPVYSATGHVLFRRGVTTPGIWAVPFSLASLQTTGEPFLVVPGGGNPSVSNDGTLVYVEDDDAGPRGARLVWLDRQGDVSAEVSQDESQLIQLPDLCLTPDGERVAHAVSRDNEVEFWSLDLERGTRRRLTPSAPAYYWECAWGPDGRELYYTNGATAEATWILSVDANGSGEPRRVARGRSPSVSPDGRRLFYREVDASLGGAGLPEGTRRILVKDLTSDAGPESFSAPRGSGTGLFTPAVSPDGRWVAYVSRETGRPEVWVADATDGGARWLVSPRSGSRPLWSPKGDELFYLEGGRTLMAVAVVAAEGSLRVDAPRVLFDLPESRLSRPEYVDEALAVSPDGLRFLVLLGDQQEAVQELILIENWYSEFDDRGGSPR